MINYEKLWRIFQLKIVKFGKGKSGPAAESRIAARGDGAVVRKVGFEGQKYLPVEGKSGCG